MLACLIVLVLVCERFPIAYDSMASVDKQLLGTETAQAMRTKGVTSVICGLSANDIRDSFLSSGANDFLLKPMPCKVDELRAALAKILRHRTT